jgi:hypothetical protein
MAIIWGAIVAGCPHDTNIVAAIDRNTAAVERQTDMLIDARQCPAVEAP